MEKKTREYLQVTQQDSDRVNRLIIPTLGPETSCSFYEEFSIRGIQADLFQSGFISCSFIVPPRLIDRDGNLAVGAIANLVDKIGSCALYGKDVPIHVSVDMSISYLSTAKLNDELEITAKLLGGKGSYKGTLVVLKNKLTREIIAEGRHSLFSLSTSRI
ncbi:Thioesterase superfamily [Artemisia annua]|uniref:Acyl-coenzyme A thioesterase 13 n=1 Tax=Artemisia annua TaxID=35608 RepID=A0A2U1NKW0_ARTAN|nr:Thioesterase superfamily [Artemisia annua]